MALPAKESSEGRITEDPRKLLKPDRAGGQAKQVRLDDPSFKLGGEPRPLKNESALADERVVTSDVSIDESATGRYSAGSLSGSDKFGHAYHRVLLGADLIALFVSSALTFLCVAAIGRGIDATDWALLILAVAPVWVLIAYQLGLYSQVERQIDFDYVAEIMPMIFASTVWCWFLVLARSLVTVGDTDLMTPAVMWIVMIPVLLSCRSAARLIASSRPWYRRPIALIGDVVTVDFLDERINRHPEWGLSVGLEVVRLDRDQGWQVRHPSIDSGLLTASTNGQVGDKDPMVARLAQLVFESGLDRAMIAGGLQRMSSRTELVATLVSRGVAVDYAVGGPETLYANAMSQHLEGISLMSSRPSHPRPMAVGMKRSFDVAVSAGALLLASPLLILSAMAIKLDSKGPVVFRQLRGGRDGEPFRICKLRTMCEEADDLRESLWGEGIHGAESGMLKVKNDPRITRVGNFLRRWSLDEIPQFWNVLVGDMSLVGPRPLPLDEAAGVDEAYLARQRVRPGITGPWQVMGRSEIPMEDMLKLDCTYVSGWSFAEDVRIMLRTVSATTGKTGVY